MVGDKLADIIYLKIVGIDKHECVSWCMHTLPSTAIQPSSLRLCLATSANVKRFGPVAVVHAAGSPMIAIILPAVDHCGVVGSSIDVGAMESELCLLPPSFIR